MSVCYFGRSFLVIIHQQPTFRKNLCESLGFRRAVGPDPARRVRHLHALLPARRNLFVENKLDAADPLSELDKTDGDENRTEFFEQPRRGPRENIRDMPVVVNRLSTIQDCVVCRSSLPAAPGRTAQEPSKEKLCQAPCCMLQTGPIRNTIHIFKMCWPRLWTTGRCNPTVPYAGFDGRRS